MSARIAVLGGGSWGTALAAHLGRLGHDVALWARDGDLVADIRARRVNRLYLPEVELPAVVRPTASLPDALAGSRYVVVAVPSHGLRDVVRAAVPHVPAEAVIVSGAKGLELDTLRRMSEVIVEEAGSSRPVVVLSGPSFAIEVARGLPTAVVAASTDRRAIAAVQRDFRGRAFRIYGSEDVVGVEIGGAAKNVIAIAAGVVQGLELGHNALAALVTRGLVEISRLACALGARRETLAGLSGLGDLVLTCTGELSRNRRVGLELARGRPLDAVLAGLRMVAEGVRTARAALELGFRCGAELPITAQVAELLAGRKTPGQAVDELMLRPQKLEQE
ncbi:MAG TPA: NAD(P)H-dependent glycerol-3-phosphate dehydrogenase [Vicinamibacterales bacterium]|nr:NAD(P)H-dependent glycerol-3-phosphate dehydrogenase [Vicinamibacterales bacterium]